MGDNLKSLAKSRLLEEMLGSVRESGGGEWSVLVMDEITTRVMSSSCRISDVLDYGVSLVDMVTKRREPLPISGVYFISASETSIRALIEDFKYKPMYKTAHVFFSSRVPQGVLAELKSCSGLLSRLKSLKEVNMEFLVADKRTFLTDKEKALQTLFGEANDIQETFNAEILSIADRVATAFASLKEFPSIRFRAAKPGENGATDIQSLVAQRIAVNVDERLGMLQRTGQVPSAETCDLIITDRGFDPVAPVIHEWTYEAMVYDLLKLNGNVYNYDIETEGGKAETKSHILDERDAIWVELRHQHFAAASLRISSMLDDFRKKNKAASYVRNKGGAEAGSAGLDMRGMRNLVKALPQYREQLAQLSVHADIASKLNRLIDEKVLVEMGKLEQDLVYGNATSKEVVTFLNYNRTMGTEEKMRLLMCYVATHPEKLDATKEQQWQKLANLSQEDMTTITNLEFIGVPVRKRGKTTGLNFGRKRKRAVRKDRPPGEDEQTWELSRFTPMLQEVIEELVAGSLSSDEYPHVRPPHAASNGVGAAGKGASVRSKAGWTKKAAGTGYSSATGIAETVTKGRRIVVFVVGGITRSEMRVAHLLSKKLGRDIVLGGTSIDEPEIFLKNLLALGSVDFNGDRHQSQPQGFNNSDAILDSH